MSATARSRKQSSVFRLQYGVDIDIRATPTRIWNLLTNANDFPRWNTTVTRIAGNIAPGNQLEVHVPIAPNRTFKPKVVEFEPCRRMVWSDGMAPMFKGIRVFTLTENGGGTTRFSMQETLSGLMLPMIKGSLPDFGPVFERYASDLKREAESGL